MDYLREPLLEYVIELCDNILPTVLLDENEEPYLSTSLAPKTFAIRYHKGLISTSSDFRLKYDNDEWIVNTLQKLNYDRNKFWYLLLFVKDYIYTMQYKSYKTGTSSLDELMLLWNVVNENEENAEIKIYIDKKHQHTISRPTSIRFLRTALYNGMMKMQEEKEKISITTPLIREYKQKVATPAILWLFKDTFYKFLPEKYPRGNAIGEKTKILGKANFVARLLYITEIKENYDDPIKSSDKLKSDINKYGNSDLDKYFNTVYHC
ncbi:hypothetical protein D0T85_01805 [Bacteroides sp. 519]|nr:hypothetical protein [Bacteroides sp. 519]